MLVLSRRENESIRIGDEIEIRVYRVARNRVRLAIVAPDDIRIQRLERVAQREDCPDEFDGMPELRTTPAVISI